MKASQLIELLQKTIEEHGDIQVMKVSSANGSAVGVTPTLTNIRIKTDARALPRFVNKTTSKVNYGNKVLKV